MHQVMISNAPLVHAVVIKQKYDQRPGVKTAQPETAAQQLEVKLQLWEKRRGRPAAD